MSHSTLPSPHQATQHRHSARKQLFKRFRDVFLSVQTNGVAHITSQLLDLDRRINDTNFEVDQWGFRAFWHPAGLLESEVQAFFSECAAIASSQHQQPTAAAGGGGGEAVPESQRNVTVDLAEAAVFVRRALGCRRQQLHDILKRIRAKQLDPYECPFYKRAFWDNSQKSVAAPPPVSRVLVFNYLVTKGGLTHSEAFLLMDACSTPKKGSASSSHYISDGIYANYGGSQQHQEQEQEQQQQQEDELELFLLASSIFTFPLPDSIALSLLLGKVVDALCDSFRGAGPTGVSAIVSAATKALGGGGGPPARGGEEEQQQEQHERLEQFLLFGGEAEGSSRGGDVNIDAESFYSICHNIAAGMPRAECTLLHTLLADSSSSAQDDGEDDTVVQYDYDADDNAAAVIVQRSPAAAARKQHQQQQRRIISLRYLLDAVEQRIPSLSPAAFYITVGEVRQHILNSSSFSRLFLELVHAVRASGGRVLERSTTVAAFRRAGISASAVPDIVVEQLTARFRVANEGGLMTVGGEEGGIGGGDAWQSATRFLRDFVDTLRGPPSASRNSMVEKLFHRLTVSAADANNNNNNNARAGGADGDDDGQKKEVPLLVGEQLLRCFAPDLVQGGGGTQQQRLQKTAMRCYDDLVEFVKMLETLRRESFDLDDEEEQFWQQQQQVLPRAHAVVGRFVKLSLAEFLFFWGNFSATVADDSEFTVVLWEGFSMYKSASGTAVSAAKLPHSSSASPAQQQQQRATTPHRRVVDNKNSNKKPEPVGIADVIAASHEAARKRRQAMQALQEPQQQQQYDAAASPSSESNIVSPMSGTSTPQQQTPRPNRRGQVPEIQLRQLEQSKEEQRLSTPRRQFVSAPQQQQQQQADNSAAAAVPKYHHHYHHDPASNAPATASVTGTPRRRLHAEIQRRQQQQQQEEEAAAATAPAAAAGVSDKPTPVEKSSHYHVRIGEREASSAEQQQQDDQRSYEWRDGEQQRRQQELHEGETVGYTEDGRRIVAHIVDEDVEPAVRHLHHLHPEPPHHFDTRKPSPPRPELADAVPMMQHHHRSPQSSSVGSTPRGQQQQHHSRSPPRYYSTAAVVTGTTQQHQEQMNRAQRRQAIEAQTAAGAARRQQQQEAEQERRQQQEDRLMEAPEHPLLHKKRLRRPTALEAYMAADAKLARDINAYHHRPPQSGPAPARRRSPLRTRTPHELPPPEAGNMNVFALSSNNPSQQQQQNKFGKRMGGGRKHHSESPVPADPQSHQHHAQQRQYQGFLPSFGSADMQWNGQVKPTADEEEE